MIKIAHDSCNVCTVHSSKPLRFNLTLGTYIMCFNHQFYVYTMFITGIPVINLVYEGTHFT